MSDFAYSDGDFFTPTVGRGRDGNNVHIAVVRGPNDPAGAVRSACGRFYERTRPATEDEAASERRCEKCWEDF